MIKVIKTHFRNFRRVKPNADAVVFYNTLDEIEHDVLDTVESIKNKYMPTLGGIHQNIVRTDNEINLTVWDTYERNTVFWKIFPIN